MLQTVDWLLPCIPNALYGGLTRKVIDRLLALRSAAEQVWAKLMPLERQPEFADLFSTALATFNGEPEAVVPQLVQDELLGEMSCRSGMSWNTLLAELSDSQSKRQALLGPPAEKVLWPPPPEAEKAPLPEPEPPTESAVPDEPRPSPLVNTARSLFAYWGLDACIQPDDSAPASLIAGSTVTVAVITTYIRRLAQCWSVSYYPHHYWTGWPDILRLFHP